jgi:hypothetical protein
MPSSPKRRGGNPTLVHITKTKMLVKGINPYGYTAPTPAGDVEEIRQGLRTIRPKVVFFFVSLRYDNEELSRRMGNAFPGAAIFNCTTAGEIMSGQLLKGSVVTMALEEEIVGDVAGQVVSGIGKETSAIEGAFSAFSTHFGVSFSDMSFEEYVGVILVDGLSGAEERLMETIGDRTNVIFIGGSAGDDLEFNGKKAVDAYAASLKTQAGDAAGMWKGPL